MRNGQSPQILQWTGRFYYVHGRGGLWQHLQERRGFQVDLEGAWPGEAHIGLEFLDAKEADASGVATGKGACRAGVWL